MAKTGLIIRIGMISWNIIPAITLPPVAAIPVVTPNTDSAGFIESTDPRTYSPVTKHNTNRTKKRKQMCPTPVTRHLVIILLAFASWCLPSGAGVVYSGGKLVSAELTASDSTVHNVTFVESSWNGLTSDQQLNITTSAWYTGGSNSFTLAHSLASNLEGFIESDNTELTVKGLYIFVHFSTAVDVRGRTTFTNNPLPTSLWGVTNLQLTNPSTAGNSFDDTSLSSYGVYTWALTSTGSSAVPEPSTAIAMGLLGVVGFAGNRRRRTVA